jgi:polyisoprenoid-binding protein YceI
MSMTTSIPTVIPTVIPTGTWTVDPSHSKVGLAVKHMGIATVRGEFTEFEGTLEIGKDLSTAKAYGTVKVQSIDTNEPQRDEHLRSPDFFDAAQYPEIRFESTSIEALDDEELRITGKPTIHGVTNDIVLHADVQGTTSTRGVTSGSASRSPASSRAATTT